MTAKSWIVGAALFCVTAIALAQPPQPLVILDEPLPSFDAGIETRHMLHARGGIPPYRWRVSAGDLPEGIALTPEGFLVGRPAKAGAYSFTVAVEDSDEPANTISKELRVQVSATLVLDWLQPPQAHGDSIDGSVQVSNGAKDDFDLTVIIVAVNEMGRATALGYQHVTLKPGTVNLQIPFGSKLPRGAYVVHADAVAEIAAKNTILRRRLQTPAPLPVTQGP